MVVRDSILLVLGIYFLFSGVEWPLRQLCGRTITEVFGNHLVATKEAVRVGSAPHLLVRRYLYYTILYRYLESAHPRSRRPPRWFIAKYPKATTSKRGKARAKPAYLTGPGFFICMIAQAVRASYSVIDLVNRCPLVHKLDDEAESSLLVCNVNDSMMTRFSKDIKRDMLVLYYIHHD